MRPIRVRFAPSPTGALHIGGVRTALYNYCLAHKFNGTFILRIEDTDQTRYVPGAEAYIVEALKWCGIMPSEGPGIGGDYGPYRQSERKPIYRQYADQLLAAGRAYYAFDSTEDLEAMREEAAAKGNPPPKYDATIRHRMNNSLSLSAEEVARRLAEGQPYVIRLKVDPGETVTFFDHVRGEVSFHTDELDDKVMLKADGMPTYHLANVVDDYLMKISHVIRGEEWLPSTAHHVLLYRGFGWEAAMPEFAHLPLILKPDGKGKLSKRDGKRLGIPVFPLSWAGESAEEAFEGFREAGFLPQAVLNFLALLGWNPGSERELFGLGELCDAFSLERVVKSGARFDYGKAKWFNQQYIIHSDSQVLARLVAPLIEAEGHQADTAYLAAFCDLFKERVESLKEFWTAGYYCFEPVRDYDEKNIKKRWNPEHRPHFELLAQWLGALDSWDVPSIEGCVQDLMAHTGLKPGAVLPILRLGLTGTMQGPGIFDVMALLGQAPCAERLRSALDRLAAMAAG